MQSAKINIKKVVDTYIKMCPEEYENFKHAMKFRREMMKDQKYGTVGTDSGMRALFEMPVALHDMLINNLTEDQITWLKKGGENGHEGGRWFARTFPVFALPQEI
jgi:hypothetical protein